MSNDLQDVFIAVLAAGWLGTSGIVAYLLARLRRLQRGHDRASGVEAAARESQQHRRHLTVVRSFLGMAVVVGAARWLGRVGAHPVTAAIALVGVGIAGTAIVLLPVETEMPPQAASPGGPLTSAPHYISDPPTAPPAAPPAVSLTTSSPPSTTAPPSTIVRPGSRPSPSTVSSAPVPPDTISVETTATAPKPDKADAKAGVKVDKVKAADNAPPSAAPASVAQASDSTPAQPRLHLPYVRLLVIDLGDCGT